MRKNVEEMLILMGEDTGWELKQFLIAREFGAPMSSWMVQRVTMSTR